MIGWILALLPGWATGWLGSKLGLQIGIALGFTVLVGFVALRIFNMGRNAAATEALNAQVQDMRRKLAIRKRQLAAAANRPSDSELDRVLESGEF